MWSRLWLCSIVAAVLAVYYTLSAQAASSTGTGSFLSNQLGRAHRQEAQTLRRSDEEEEEEDDDDNNNNNSRSSREEQKQTQLDQQQEPNELQLIELAADSHLTSASQQQRRRRLIKRSGISDQRLAEMQMMRALRKQLELKAFKQQAQESSSGAKEISESS